MDYANTRCVQNRLEKRRQAMLDMPKMIQEWKQVGSQCILKSSRKRDANAGGQFSAATVVDGRSGRNNRARTDERLGEGEEGGAAV